MNSKPVRVVSAVAKYCRSTLENRSDGNLTAPELQHSGLIKPATCAEKQKWWGVEQLLLSQDRGQADQHNKNQAVNNARRESASFGPREVSTTDRSSVAKIAEGLQRKGIGSVTA